MKILAAVIFVSATLFADISLTGSVVSKNQKMITSRYMGFVKKIYVSEGMEVAKGAPLYDIDSKEIDSAKRQLELTLAMHKNRYVNVKLNLQRHKRLYEKDMVAKYEVENLEVAAKNLENMIDITKQRIKEVQNQYRYLHIKAPAKGVVIAKNIDEGEMAMPGMPAFIISDLDDLLVETEVAESQMQTVFVGKEVEVSIPARNLKQKAHISAVIPNSNPMTHKFKIKIQLQQMPAAIYPGMYAKVLIKR